MTQRSANPRVTKQNDKNHDSKPLLANYPIHSKRFQYNYHSQSNKYKHFQIKNLKATMIMPTLIHARNKLLPSATGHNASPSWRDDSNSQYPNDAIPQKRQGLEMTSNQGWISPIVRWVGRGLVNGATRTAVHCRYLHVYFIMLDWAPVAQCSREKAFAHPPETIWWKGNTSASSELKNFWRANRRLSLFWFQDPT